MADTEQVFARLRREPNVTYRALWLNPRGLDRAVAVGNVDLDGRLQLTASEAFVKRNTNRSIDETFADLPDWITRYRAAGVAPDCLGLMAAFGCNFEGDVPIARVVDIIARAEVLLVQAGSSLRQLALADTMGWATPDRIRRMIGVVRERWPNLAIKLHLHDTRGTAMANALAALEMGVREFDGSIGGLGGCPFAGHKGAAGNICTEDLAYMCEEMGIDTGIDLPAFITRSRSTPIRETLQPPLIVKLYRNPGSNQRINPVPAGRLGPAAQNAGRQLSGGFKIDVPQAHAQIDINLRV
jgi:hydroxymethylglutaryl-CoA lyase